MPSRSARRYLAKLFNRTTRSERPNTSYASTVQTVVQQPSVVEEDITRSVSTKCSHGFHTTKEGKASGLRPSSCPAKPNLLPEHRVALKNRIYFDQAVPKALQQSQTSIDLQLVSRSEEAGRLPFCEDVAQRNIDEYRPRRMSASGNAVQSGHGSFSANRSPPYTVTLQPTGGANARLEARRRSHRHSVQADEQNATREARARAQPGSPQHERIGEVYLPPLRRDGRRRSLSHKADVVDLRTASGHGSSGDRQRTPGRHRPVSEGCRSPPQIGLTLDKPLPPTPARRIGPPSMATPKSVNRLPHDFEHTSCHRPPTIDFRRWSAPQPTEDTTYSEEWRPAVTHEIIQQDVHEICEEQIHKEIHQYHVRHKIQPIIDYEILPPRHFVHVEGGGYTEVAESDLPAGTPGASWFTTEIRSQLGSSMQCGHMPELHDAATPREEFANSEPAWPREESWAQSTTWQPAVFEDTKYRFMFDLKKYDDEIGID